MQVEVENYFDLGSCQNELVSELERVDSLSIEEICETYGTAEERALIANIRKEALIAKSLGLILIASAKTEIVSNLVDSIKGRARDLVRIKIVNDMGLKAVEDINIWSKWLEGDVPVPLFEGSFRDPYMPLSVLEAVASIKETKLFEFLYVFQCRREYGRELALFGKFYGNHSEYFLLARWFEYKDELAAQSGRNLVKADKFLRPLDEIRVKVANSLVRQKELKGTRKYMPNRVRRLFGL